MVDIVDSDLLLPGNWNGWKEKDHPTLFVLVGLPGSGKSTWAKAESQTGKTYHYDILSTDYFLELFAAQVEKTYKWAFENRFADAKKRMYEQAQYAFKYKKNVIWDQTNMTIKSRRRCTSMAPKHYYKVAVVFEVSDLELGTRLTLREVKDGKHIPQQVIHKMKRYYQEPTLDEDFDKVFFNLGAKYEELMEDYI